VISIKKDRDNNESLGQDVTKQPTNFPVPISPCWTNNGGRLLRFQIADDYMVNFNNPVDNRQTNIAVLKEMTDRQSRQ